MARWKYAEIYSAADAGFVGPKLRHFYKIFGEKEQKLEESRVDGTIKKFGEDGWELVNYVEYIPAGGLYRRRWIFKKLIDKGSPLPSPI